MPAPACLHFLCGKAGAGKSTLAKALAEAHHAILISEDIWLARLFGEHVVDSVCVVRYDNEIGKGDHRHFGATENAYKFRTPERLMVDFQEDIARWNDENSDS